ncbi:MAG: hypothetical protein A4S09_10205 [Proteobacteria bacterium SG_bin7]|nr:MAG: hypothetical protein A4S09_10205 [Proteobacteria bacterium SG_bin7]
MKVSTKNTINNGELEIGMLPRGSALITSSGDLRQTGITSIIHAASGSMTRSGNYFEPNLDSIKNSVFNSVLLAEQNKHQSVLIPLIGGGIFLNRVGISRTELAKQIILAALQARKNIKLGFIGMADLDYGAFKEAYLEIQSTVTIPAKSIEIYKGSIIDFKFHQCTAIVNAANTEVRFGGGISGAIGQASGKMNEIENEAQIIIRSIKNM